VSKTWSEIFYHPNWLELEAGKLCSLLPTVRGLKLCANVCKCNYCPCDKSARFQAQRLSSRLAGAGACYFVMAATVGRLRPRRAKGERERWRWSWVGDGDVANSAHATAATPEREGASHWGLEAPMGQLWESVTLCSPARPSNSPLSLCGFIIPAKSLEGGRAGRFD